MTRIKYISIKNTPILSTKDPIICNNKAVHIIINTETLVYKLYTIKQVLMEGQGKTLTACKKRIKEDLVFLGAEFDSEIRNRGNTKKL